MTIDVKSSSNALSRVAQPYMKLAGTTWTALKRVMTKTAAGWQEVWPSVYVYIHTGTGYNMNMHACFGYSSIVGSYLFINNGVIGGSTSAPSLVTGTFPAGSKVVLLNNGLITGQGGNGSSFTDGSGGVRQASPGTEGLMLTYPVTIDNTNGQINAGGGGGGATGDFAGDTRHNAPGGGGAGVPGGLSKIDNWGTYAAHPGSAYAGGAGFDGSFVWGCGGNPGVNGQPETRIVNNDKSKMTMGAPAGIAIRNYGYVQGDSVGLGAGKVNGRIVHGLAGAPYIRCTAMSGDGNYGAAMYVILELGGASPVSSVSWVSGGADITVAKNSNNQFAFYSSLVITGTLSENTWRTGVARFYVSAANGSDYFDLAIRVGVVKKAATGGNK